MSSRIGWSSGASRQTRPSQGRRRVGDWSCLRHSTMRRRLHPRDTASVRRSAAGRVAAGGAARAGGVGRQERGAGPSDARCRARDVHDVLPTRFGGAGRAPLRQHHAASAAGGRGASMTRCVRPRRSLSPAELRRMRTRRSLRLDAMLTPLKAGYEQSAGRRRIGCQASSWWRSSMGCCCHGPGRGRFGLAGEPIGSIGLVGR